MQNWDIYLGSVGQQGYGDLQGQGRECGRLDAVTSMAFGLFPDPKTDLTLMEKCLGQITVTNK